MIADRRLDPVPGVLGELGIGDDPDLEPVGPHLPHLELPHASLAVEQMREELAMDQPAGGRTDSH